MRINRYVAQVTGLSRRAVDDVIAKGRIKVNEQLAIPGQSVEPDDLIELDNKALTAPLPPQTIMLNKPVGVITSRSGQGGKTIYDLLPDELHRLKPVGRLDKDSTGLLLLTSDGDLAHRLTHPSFVKTKTYEVTLDKALRPAHQAQLRRGVALDDGPSRISLSGRGTQWTVKLHEGRNRQIRRSFAALGYKVISLNRTEFGPYLLGELMPGKFQIL